MNMLTKHIKSWVVVLSLFFVVVLLVSLWGRFNTTNEELLEVQHVSDPESISADIQPSMVSFWAVKRQEVGTQIGMIGCGVIVDARGYVLTSVNLTEDIESLHITDWKDNQYEANVIRTHTLSRLTLLKIEPDNTIGTVLKAAQLGDSAELVEDQGVVAIGGRMNRSSWELTGKVGKITKQSQTLVVDKKNIADWSKPMCR